MFAVYHAKPSNPERLVLNAIFRNYHDAHAFCNLYDWTTLDVTGILCGLEIVEVSEEEVKEMFL